MSSKSDDKFNDEVAWNIKRNLFDKYFRHTILRQRHITSQLKTTKKDFSAAVLDIKKQTKN